MTSPCRRGGGFRIFIAQQHRRFDRRDKRFSAAEAREKAPVPRSLRLGGSGERSGMNSQAPSRPVERLFPFVLRSRNLLVGRDTLRRSKRKLHFVLITRDTSE